MLYVPTEYALHVYDTLMEKGKNYGIINAGYFALRALRIEKMFAFWGQDLDKNTTPYGNNIKLAIRLIELGFYLMLLFFLRMR
jgi:pyruvate dehydrogenase phosphatase regulatory subunit